ncbi:MAG: DEAD/DEAH box helicase [Alphaproteobacteria bacterium]|jgi:superfamily II DNA/RNA helicase|nr:DEAD/DEAH box helicase [Alphaproteobacteria bacterium]
MKFSDLGLSAELEQTVNKLGYAIPTPIQEQAIPQILRGRDLFGCAQTGTGKTASFILPMIDVLHGSRSKVRMPRSIVLEPTRELAAQVLESFETYGKDHKLKAALLVGGESMSDQEKQLKRGVDVLIATPGRLLDLFERGQILLADVKILVIDEADRMLDMGFIPDVDRIVATLPKMRQTLLFSATMPAEIKKLAQSYLINPKEIIIAPTTRTAATVTQHVVRVEDAKKREALREILGAQENPGPIIIFCNRKRDISVLTSALKKFGYEAGSLHGDMAQSQRNQTLEEFKNGKVTVLVASDVAARGLDVDGLSLVVNFDVPMNAEDYVHRIGRTGRAGNAGVAITLVSSHDEKYLAGVQAFIQQDIPIMTLGGEPAKEQPVKADTSKGKSSKGKASKATAKSNQQTKSSVEDKIGEINRRHEEETKQKAAEKSDKIAKASDSPPSQKKPDRPKQQSPHKRSSRQPESDGPDEPRVGFGSEVPAFMLKAVNLKQP